MFTGKTNMGASSFLYPTPLVLCGTYDSEGRPNLAALAWAGLCCSEPPAIQISIRKQRLTYSSIVERREFTVNVPSYEYVAQADFCGMVSGRSVDKFERARLTPLRGQHVNAPLVDEFPLCLECGLLHTFAVGSHDIFVGEILASWVRDECLDDDGVPAPLKISPIAYAPLKGGGRYFALGKRSVKAFEVGRALAERE
ncbi:MAG: flavin reductase family protein [Synergistaceae bacterium]|jgi:flavin reductase (DIM6/NTAB) family NADH-FMN oxidoreductase RutF|nr:flavin reductase family protein [Synergistaceae bacterium]